MASLKRQFTELLSDIGFVKEGLRAREIEKRAQGGDGVLDATGEEVKHVCLSGSLQFLACYRNMAWGVTASLHLSPVSRGWPALDLPCPQMHPFCVITEVVLLPDELMFLCSEAISICWSFSVSHKPGFLSWVLISTACVCLFV